MSNTGRKKRKAIVLKSDALVKKLITSNIIVARELLDEYLPEHVKSKLNMDTIKVEKESYVEDSLKRQLSDVVLSVKTKDNEDAFVYILLESQSTVDPTIAFRLWKYSLLLLERHIKDKKKLPLIAPIVLYNGKSKYTAAKSLWELFEDPELAKQMMGDQYQGLRMKNFIDRVSEVLH